MRNLLDLSAIMALGNLKPNISWHSVSLTVYGYRLNIKFYSSTQEPHDAVRSSVARIKDSFWFYFSELV